MCSMNMPKSVVPLHEVCTSRSGRRILQLFGQIRGYALICINQKNPWTCSLLNTKIFLRRPVPAETSREDLRPKSSGRFHCTVGAAVVHDDPLVGETAAFKTRFNVMHFIARQEHNRNSLSVFLVIFDHVVPSYSVLSVYSKKRLRGLMSPDGALSLV